MQFNKHFAIRERHAFLSPSSPHWVNYDPDKLRLRYSSARAAQRGSDLHNLAHEAIRLGVKLDKSNKALARYVNDGIGYKMECEQALYYSENCFGHADTLSFRRGFLRIHDLKTGLSPVKMKQLEVYVALFCLEYGIDPEDIRIELRIYQGDAVEVHVPTLLEIRHIMKTIVEHDARIQEFKADEEV